MQESTKIPNLDSEATITRQFEVPTGPERREPIARKIGHAIHTLFEKFAGEQDLLGQAANSEPPLFHKPLDEDKLIETALRNDPYSYERGRFVARNLRHNLSDSA